MLLALLIDQPLVVMPAIGGRSSSSTMLDQPLVHDGKDMHSDLEKDMHNDW